MQDRDVVVASYLMIGLTEEDTHYIRKHLQSYGQMFVEEDENPNVFRVEVINDSIYPCIALKVDAEVWERFARSHDMVEFSAVMAQSNILGVVH
jgi:hypothetical protein